MSRQPNEMDARPRRHRLRRVCQDLREVQGLAVPNEIRRSVHGVLRVAENRGGAIIAVKIK